MSKSALVKTRTTQELFERLERIRLDPRVRRERSDFYRFILEEYADRAERAGLAPAPLHDTPTTAPQPATKAVSYLKPKRPKK